MSVNLKARPNCYICEAKLNNETTLLYYDGIVVKDTNGTEDAYVYTNEIEDMYYVNDCDLIKS